MAPDKLKTRLGPIELRSPLIAASGTVGSVWEWARVADPAPYGAAVAKSVAPVEWAGRDAPRLAPAGPGMLNGIGIQNPGIEAWLEKMTPLLPQLDVPVWGSAVGETPDEFACCRQGPRLRRFARRRSEPLLPEPRRWADVLTRCEKVGRSHQRGRRRV